MGCGLFYIAHEAGGDAEETLALTVGKDGPCAVLVVDASMEHYGVDISVEALLALTDQYMPMRSCTPMALTVL